MHTESIRMETPLPSFDAPPIQKANRVRSPGRRKPDATHTIISGLKGSLARFRPGLGLMEDPLVLYKYK